MKYYIECDDIIEAVKANPDRYYFMSSYIEAFINTVAECDKCEEKGYVYEKNSAKINIWKQDVEDFCRYYLFMSEDDINLFKTQSYLKTADEAQRHLDNLSKYTEKAVNSRNIKVAKDFYHYVTYR